MRTLASTNYTAVNILSKTLEVGFGEHVYRVCLLNYILKFESQIMDLISHTKQAYIQKISCFIIIIINNNNNNNIIIIIIMQCR